MELKLRIECVELPPPNWDGHAQIWLGIQRGKEVIQQVKLPVDSATFEADLRVADDSDAGAPNFLGPFAQGTPTDRFVYLCWGQPHMGQWAGFRRLKLPLAGLTWELIKAGEPMVRVRCTDLKGGPLCATAKPDFLSWGSKPG